MRTEAYGDIRVRVEAATAESITHARSAPDAATKPCALAVPPDDPTAADLDAAYMQPGAQAVTCDTARALAVETLTTERRLNDEWLRLEERRRQVAQILARLVWGAPF
ncbi:hypothetical protein [Brevundimonas sp.]|uniref:hypothetical protein n=1 Tax=Brevundimonas sp. TaxID=1871086 RepID=UPI001AC6C461|nr:hypothetical protein [Brevundimonas sp.]MBN9467029.1 hypothetical protein [Brevundimonas sp.]